MSVISPILTTRIPSDLDKEIEELRGIENTKRCEMFDKPVSYGDFCKKLIRIGIKSIKENGKKEQG